MGDFFTYIHINPPFTQVSNRQMAAVDTKSGTLPMGTVNVYAWVGGKPGNTLVVVLGGIFFKERGSYSC